MRSFQKNNRFRHAMQSKPFLVFLGILIIIFIFSMFGFISKMQDTIKNRKAVEDRIAELEESKVKLNSEIVKLKTDKGVEENIREKFGLAKEGEDMIIVIEDKNKPKPEKDKESSGFFSFFINLFK